jgi:ADA HAT complex component 1
LLDAFATSQLSFARSLEATSDTEELLKTPVARATGRGSGAHGLQAVKRNRNWVIADEEDDGVSLGRLNVAAQSAAGGMLRLLSWSSGLGADKIAPPEVNVPAARQQRKSNMESQQGQTMKRKRPVDGDMTEDPRTPAKRRIERRTHVLVPKQSLSVGSSGVSPPPDPQKAPMPSQTSVATQVTEVHDQVANSPLPDITMPSQRTPAEVESLRRTIQSQIGLEILLKHKELRLIDQELAKCQVALEQLRRCSEIPYPASRLSEAVSNGMGPALRTPFSGALPQSPAPWGVTDGPYSRHYAKWLLPDSSFDGGYEADQAIPSNPAGKNPAKGRTRGGVPDTVGVSTKSRIRGGGQLKALSSGYPQPKDKAGLVIQKRKSDGLIIKLVCLDCRRENFSSAQGFINHCRIAHNRSFASHDAAADACGEPVEVDEAGLVIGNETSSTSSAGMVHPLIRSAHLLKNKTETPTVTHADDVTKNSLPSTGVTLLDEPRLMGSPPPSYRASILTPNLSALVKLKGLGLDLEKLVSDAKTPVTVEDSASDESGDEGAVTPEAAPFRGRHPQVAGTKQPARSAMSPPPMDRSSSMKGAKRDQKLQSLEHLATPSSSSPLLPRHLASTSYDPQECDSLEPSPTNESNQAPSLVDDDEDYDPHSPSLSSSVSDDGDDAEPEFEIQDDEPSGPSTRTASASDTEYTGTAKERPFHPQRGRPSAIRRSIGDREEKHVSFVSPSPVREMLASSGKGNDKKRKRS